MRQNPGGYNRPITPLSRGGIYPPIVAPVVTPNECDTILQEEREYEKRLFMTTIINRSLAGFAGSCDSDNTFNR